MLIIVFFFFFLEFFVELGKIFCSLVTHIDSKGGIDWLITESGLSLHGINDLMGLVFRFQATLGRSLAGGKTKFIN